MAFVLKRGASARKIPADGGTAELDCARGLEVPVNVHMSQDPSHVGDESQPVSILECTVCAVKIAANSGRTKPYFPYGPEVVLEP